ncbi:hypothetical protein [Variovorax sp. dw_308]|uniref:hypothetical protein n=1 Tax=Variovorax sp. dw_308 TaxID=2721546 RepID=UPI001C4404F9|nr:hypothetical protein [Variovorax sp. dw_308]
MSSAIEAGKAFTTLQARSALLGYTCTLTEAGNIVLGRSGGAWIFGTVEKAHAWLDRLPQQLACEVLP